MHIWLNQFLKASMQVHMNLDPAYCDEFKFNSTVCHIQTCVNMLRSQFHQLIHSLLFAKCTILCVHVYLHVIVIHCIFYVNMSIYKSVSPGQEFWLRCTLLRTACTIYSPGEILSSVCCLY